MSQQEMFDPMAADPLDVATLGTRDLLEAKHRWPQRLAELFDIQVAYNRRAGMSDTDAERDAAARVFLIAAYVSKRPMYMPGADKLRTALRDLKIHRAQGRMSVEDIATQHNLSVPHVYDILAEQTRLVRDRLQGKLFE